MATVLQTLLSRQQRAYAPQTVTLPFSVPQGTVGVLVTATRVSWPTGLVARLKVTWLDGDISYGDFEGGGNTAAKCACGVPPGLTEGTVDIVVYQDCTTAVTVEAMVSA